METLTDFRMRLMERYKIARATYYNRINELKELGYDIKPFQKGRVKSYSSYQKALITAFIAHRKGGEFTFVAEDGFKEVAEQEALPVPVPTVNEGWGDASNSLHHSLIHGSISDRGHQYNPNNTIPVTEISVIEASDYLNQRVLEWRVAQEMLVEEALKASEHFTDPQLIEQLNKTTQRIGQDRFGKQQIANNFEQILKETKPISRGVNRYRFNILSIWLTTTIAACLVLPVFGNRDKMSIAAIALSLSGVTAFLSALSGFAIDDDYSKEEPN